MQGSLIPIEFVEGWLQQVDLQQEFEQYPSNLIA
jgi:hypothetical protein